MNEERLLDMLSSDTLKKVKKLARSGNVSTVVRKIDIVIKAGILTNDNKFRNIFSNIWGHSDGWLAFFCPHVVVYYIKFLLRSESSRDYIDGLLSIKHTPNVVVIDVTSIIGKHSLISRKDDLKKYGYHAEGILFQPYFGRVADPHDPHDLELLFPSILQAPSNNQYSNYKLSDNNDPITDSDVHHCLFNRFHEHNTSSEIESLRKTSCILELNEMFNSQIEEQLHLKFDSNKHF